jgi:hypothetical protein
MLCHLYLPYNCVLQFSRIFNINFADERTSEVGSTFGPSTRRTLPMILYVILYSSGYSFNFSAKKHNLQTVLLVSSDYTVTVSKLETSFKSTVTYRSYLIGGTQTRGFGWITSREDVTGIIILTAWEIHLNQGFLIWGPRTPKGSLNRFQGVRELGWKKITSLLSLTSNWNVSFPSIMNVANKPQ